MTIKFKDVTQAKNDFAKVSQDSKATAEEKTEALSNYMEAIQKDAETRILEEARTFASDNNVLQSRGQNVLTSDERKFFNAVIEEGGFKDTDTLPTTTIERIFDDLVEEKPLLSHIGIQNFGAVTEFIHSDPEGAAVWGPLFGEIKGQLNASFRNETITQSKLTAFVPISKDMLKLGPAWIERYVRTIIMEAMAVGLEKGFVAGTGKDQPIGLLKDIKGSVVEGVYPDKASAGTLTFKPGRTTINELKGVVEKLAIRTVGKDKEEKVRNVAGKVVMVTSPFDSFGIQANATTLNANGVYVTSLPFNPIQTESLFVPKGKVAFFVKGEYIAAVGGGVDLERYKETLALEDADVFIAKQFATGKPVDEFASQVYDLDLDIAEETP